MFVFFDNNNSIGGSALLKEKLFCLTFSIANLRYAVILVFANFLFFQFIGVMYIITTRSNYIVQRM